MSLISAPLQEVSVIPNKVDNEGHHYLKVLLLSNKPTKNNWVAPYKRIGDLPKDLLDSYLNIPFINKHDHEFYDKINNILKSSGLDREQRYQKLRGECDTKKSGYIDYLFLDNPDATALYGQLKVTDKEENDYIKSHGGKETRIKFTSPAISGTYIEDETTGLKTYDLNTMKAFHLARVPIPAFDEDEAMVKGICMNGNTESCREALAYAGTEPMENVNNTCGCNKNIEMSTNQNSKTETVPDIPSNQGPIPTGDQNTTTVFKSQPEVKYTIEKPVSDAPESEQQQQNKKSNSVSSTEVYKTQKQIDEENEQIRIKEENKKLTKQVQDQFNFFLEELLATHIPRENFKKDEDYDGEKNNLKAFVLKYNVSLEDAKWFIKKSVPKVVEVEKKKGDQNQYAGFNNTYNAATVIKPTSSPPKQSGSEESTNNKNDYPIRF